MLNTRAEHDRLIALLADLGQPVTCGSEATGNYHRPIAWRLLQAGFAVPLISSVALARTREALHKGWDKNNPKDAQVMLHMIRIGATQVYQDPLAAGINDVQELSKAHDTVSKAKTEVLHRILNPLPAIVLSGGRPLPAQQPLGLVLRLPRSLPHACQYHS